jgi:hypothetical protein
MFANPKSEFLKSQTISNVQKNIQLLCTINNLLCVIPSEAKESRLKIATSLMLLAMTTYRSVKDGR